MNLKNIFSHLLIYHPEKEYSFILPETDNVSYEPKDSSEPSTQVPKDSEELEKLQQEQEPKSLFPSLSVNQEFIQVKYNSLINSDIKIREFTLTARNKQYSAFLLYIDGMVDSDAINNFVLEPLMLQNRANTFDQDENRVLSEAVTNNITVRKIKKFDLIDYIYNSLIPQNSVDKVTEFEQIVEDVNSGSCVLFIDTIATAFSIDVKGFKQRSISEPQNEMVIRGSQEAFTEVIRTNTSLLRRLVNNENLIIESLTIGNLSRTKCAICYMKNIANSDLVAEVKYRLNNLSIDYLISSRSTRTTY